MFPIPNTGVFTTVDVMAILSNIQSGQWTGNYYYVDPVNGLDLNNGQVPTNVQGQVGQGPVKTLTAGHALLVPGNNDTLVLIGNGTTAGTARVDAAFTWSANASRLVGICPGTRFSQRARIAPTGTTTAFANFFTITGSGCVFQNIQWFHGFNAGVAAAIALTISGGRNVFQNCAIDGMGDATSAADAGSRSLLITGTTGENLFQNCSIGIDTQQRTNANASVQFAVGTPRNVFENCLFPIDAGGATVLGIDVLTGGMDRFQLFNSCQFINSVKSGGTAMTGLALIGAAGGGPNGMIVFDPNCCIVGITDWGYDATSKAQMYLTGAAASATQGIGINPT